MAPEHTDQPFSHGLTARILVADDEPRLLNTLASLLRSRGYDVAEAHGGRKACELIDQQTFDLALLEIPVQKDLAFQPVVLASGHDHREGDEVFAIGNPLGLERSVSRGIVSTRNRNFGGLAYIQMTAQINPGNSGGPLFNSRGEVIGVTNMGIPSGEGLGFAIPAVYVKHFLDNNDAWAFDKDNPNTGFRYQDAPRRKNPNPPPTGATAK